MYTCASMTKCESYTMMMIVTIGDGRVVAVDK